MTSPAKCPCCGQTVVPADFLVDLASNTAARLGVSVRLEPQEAELAEALRRSLRRSLHFDQAIIALYGSDAPLRSLDNVKIRMFTLRRKLAALGVRVVTVPRVGWHIELLPGAVPDLLIGPKPGKQRYWSDADLSRLRAMWSDGASDEEIGAALDRTPAAVTTMRHTHGIVSPRRPRRAA